MTVTVTINIEGEKRQVVVSDSALAQVDLAFNPSAKPGVAHAKALAAALITLMEPIRDARQPASGRCAAEAITCVEGAAMWAVKATTRPDTPA